MLCLPAFTSVKKFTHKRDGFTLIELLITITILAIISAVVIPGLRNFNRTQELDIGKSMLYDGLRLAQSKANSSIVCPNVDPTTISLDITWSIVLKSDRYSMQYTCVDNASSPPKTHSGSEDKVYPVSTNIRMSGNACPGTTNDNNTKIDFSARKCPANSATCRTLTITCGDGAVYNYNQAGADPFTITLSNDQNLNQSINISAGGAIYAN